jgi:hypothetical protein
MAATAQVEIVRSSAQYKAASIKIDVEVEAFGTIDPDQPERYWTPRRTVKLGFHQNFSDDAELDAAIDAFAATIREAVRR